MYKNGSKNIYVKYILHDIIAQICYNTFIKESLLF